MTNFTHPASRRAGEGARYRGSPGSIAMPGEQAWHKWQQIMPALAMARQALGLNRSRLDLIEKLLACIPGETVAPDGQGMLIVHASNARLATMTHRDCDKTITRLISELAARGLLVRRASANGKRYVRRSADGAHVAFGLDLGPLLDRMPEILALAQAAEAEATACARLQEACSVLVTRLATPDDTHAELLGEARRLLRRKPIRAMLDALLNRLKIAAADDACTEADRIAGSAPGRAASAAEPVRGSAPQNACHKEPSQTPREKRSLSKSFERDEPAVPILSAEVVEQAMPRVAGLGRAVNGTLRELVDRLRCSLMIPPPLWRDALDRVGFEEAALLVMYLYERQRRIRSAPAYLRRLLADGGGDARPGTRCVQSLLA